MAFRLRLSREALRYLQRLDSSSQERITRRIEQLPEDPVASQHAKPLSGPSGLWGSRVGGWRLVYAIDRQTQTVTMERIAPRGQAYRNL